MMKLGLIGCGKVGITLLYLLRKNNQLIGVFDINKKNENLAKRVLNIKSNPGIKNLVARSEVLFIGTPDDQIRNVYGKIRPFVSNKKCIFHFSGLLSADIFPESRNIYRGSIHPFATFPKLTIPPPRKRYILFIEGDKKARLVADSMFKSKYFMIKNMNKKHKQIYHLIAIFTSNLIIGLVAASRTLARKIAWKDKEFYEVAIPIIHETIENIKKYKVENALSGPLVRGDVEIIKRHLGSLAHDKRLLKIYQTLSLEILESTIRVKNKKRIEKLLKDF